MGDAQRVDDGCARARTARGLAEPEWRLHRARRRFTPVAGERFGRLGEIVAARDSPRAAWPLARPGEGDPVVHRQASHADLAAIEIDLRIAVAATRPVGACVVDGEVLAREPLDLGGVGHVERLLADPRQGARDPIADFAMSSGPSAGGDRLPPSTPGPARCKVRPGGSSGRSRPRDLTDPASPPTISA